MTPQPAAPEKKGLPTVVTILIVLAVGFGACSCIGILAAIAIPNFIKFQARSKQAECKTVLKAAYTAERAYFTEKNQFSENPDEAAVMTDTTRAVLVFGPSGAPAGKGPNPDELAAAISAHVSGPLGVAGRCPECNITIGCGANVDNDPQIDVWSISTADRTTAGGKRIAAGTPYNDFNDVTDQPGE